MGTSNPSFFLVGSFPGHVGEMTVADSIDPRLAELERIGLGEGFREQLLRPRGIEPPRGCPHWHLKPARLPVPPRPLFECAFGPDFRLPGIAGRVSVSGGPAESSGSRNARWARPKIPSPTGSRYGSNRDSTGPGVINSQGWTLAGPAACFGRDSGYIGTSGTRPDGRLGPGLNRIRGGDRPTAFEFAQRATVADAEAEPRCPDPPGPTELAGMEKL